MNRENIMAAKDVLYFKTIDNLGCTKPVTAC
jgi:hypothetical protein